MRVADHIALWLKERGIRHVFGLIGGGNNTLFNAIAELGDAQIVCNHHEQASVMCAAYYYRTCGRLAVACVTTGGGSANAFTGVVAAWMDSVPVLILSGNETVKHLFSPERVKGVQGYHNIDPVKTFTKYAYQCKWPVDADCPWFEVKAALELGERFALEPRQGPSYIDIPKDVQGAMVS